MAVKCLGIFREITNSPNRENDDALILKAVTEELTKLGCETHLIEPENIHTVNPDEWDVVLPMCENYPALKTIDSWEWKPLLLNPPASVLNCYRSKMVPLIQQHCPELFPKTEMRYLKDLTAKPPKFWNENGAWIKRGDVHNTCTHDVHFAGKWEDTKEVKRDFESREITGAVIQEHIPGDLIKFYGVGPMKWFDWFYHNPSQVAKYHFERKELEKCAAKVAEAVSLEIYGGDAIITPKGKIYIIDVNSWPSFARVRNEARVHIARHAYARARSARGTKNNRQAQMED